MLSPSVRQAVRLVATGVGLWLVVAPVTAGELAAIRSAADGKKASAPDDGDESDRRETTARRRDRRRSTDCDDKVIVTGFSELSGNVLMAALSAPFVIPRVLVDDVDLQAVSFPVDPYQSGNALSSRTLFRDDESSGWQTVLRGQYGSDFSELSHASGRAIWDSASRFGIDTEFFYRRERLRGGAVDELWTGDVNLVYSFARGARGHFRTGLGVNWLGARGQADAGLNFTYGGELYPVRPLVLTGDVDWGRIGAASLFHGRVTVGVTRAGWGAFTGYDYFRVGDGELHAWINGVELRF